ncbi:MAG: hypothetical protein ACE5HU_04435, partial [Acidobacteriota bacterium]
MGKRVQIFSTACVVALLAVALWHGRVLANPPQLVRYQAHLADAAGVPLAGVHTLAFAIFDQQASGALLWNEGPFPVTVQGGNVDIILGGHGTPLTSVLLTAPGRWLEVTVDGNVLQPRQRLASVPFALAADRLDTKTLAEVQADIDARIGAHAGLPAAHHVKTIDATDLIAGSLDPNRLADASIAPIKIADGPGSGLDADTLDGIDSTTFSLAVSRTRTALQIATLRWYEADQTGL